MSHMNDPSSSEKRSLTILSNSAVSSDGRFTMSDIRGWGVDRGCPVGINRVGVSVGWICKVVSK